MALPSQSSRSSRSSRHVYRRRKRLNLGPVLFLFLAAAIIGGAWWGISRFIGPSEAGAGTADSGDTSETGKTEIASNIEAPKENLRPTPVQKPRESTPVVVIEQGTSMRDAVEKKEASSDTKRPSVTPSTTPTRHTVPPTRSETQILLDSAHDLLKQNKPLAARLQLDKALASGLGAADADAVRQLLQTINDQIVFSPTHYEGDPWTEVYEVRSGDSLTRIDKRRDLPTDWRLIQRVNRLANPNAIRVGQSLKLVRGPFHAIVDKSDYRLDIYAGPPGEPQSWKYMRSFRVGLGENDGTPLGTFEVRRDGKMVNPDWRNPRDHREYYGADDPRNPIGEFWVGLQGIGEDAEHTGYGLHGTIEPDSIGKDESMGCVRLVHDDIAFVYELLEERVSTVKIVP